MAHPAPGLIPGVLLLAVPMLRDPNFRRSVVLLCEHGEQGSFGLVLNRPIQLPPSEVIDGLDPYPDALSLGGPVQPNTLHFLHRLGDEIPNAIPVLDGVFWGGDFEVLRERIAAEPLTATDVRFFLGYAGWSPEQLEEEVEDGGWMVEQAAASLIFPPAPDQLWRDILRSKGGEYALLANFPDDPRLN